MLKSLMTALFGGKKISEDTGVHQVICSGSSNNIQQVVKTRGGHTVVAQRDNNGNKQTVSIGRGVTHGNITINRQPVESVKITAGTNTIVTSVSSSESEINTSVGPYHVEFRITPSSLQIEADGHKLNITGDWNKFTRSYVVGPVSVKFNKGRIKVLPA